MQKNGASRYGTRMQKLLRNIIPLCTAYKRISENIHKTIPGRTGDISGSSTTDQVYLVYVSRTQQKLGHNVDIYQIMTHSNETFDNVDKVKILRNYVRIPQQSWQHSPEWPWQISRLFWVKEQNQISEPLTITQDLKQGDGCWATECNIGISGNVNETEMEHFWVKRRGNLKQVRFCECRPWLPSSLSVTLFRYPVYRA